MTKGNGGKTIDKRLQIKSEYCTDL